MRKDDPLSLVKEMVQEGTLREADVLEVHTETRQATIRLRSTSLTVVAGLGSIDPQLVLNSRSRLLVYVGPLGSVTAVALIQDRPISSSAPGVTLGDIHGATSFNVLNSARDVVFSVNSLGDMSFPAGTYSTYDWNPAEFISAPVITTAPSSVFTHERELSGGLGIDLADNGPGNDIVVFIDTSEDLDWLGDHTFAEDVNLVDTASLVLEDGAAVGLGAGAGRLVFNDEATDEVVFTDCFVGIGGTPSYELDVDGDVAVTGTIGFLGFPPVAHAGVGYIGSLSDRDSFYTFAANVDITTQSNLGQYVAVLSSIQIDGTHTGLQLAGNYGSVKWGSTGKVWDLYGLNSYVTADGGDVSRMYGGAFRLYIGSNNTGTVADTYGAQVYLNTNNMSPGDMTNFYAFHYSHYGTELPTNYFGLYVADDGLHHYLDEFVGIGAEPSGSYNLEVTGTTGFEGNVNLDGNLTVEDGHYIYMDDASTFMMATGGDFLVSAENWFGFTAPDIQLTGAVAISGNLAFSGSRTITTTSDGDLTIQPDGTGHIIAGTDVQWSSGKRAYSEFTSGSFGAGWEIKYDGTSSFAEVDNLTVRGTMRTHIFQYDIVRATNGYLFIADSSEITHAADVGNSYIFCKHNVFQAGDLLWYKDFDLDAGSISEVKMTVSSADGGVSKNGQTVYQYTVSVDTGSLADLDAGGTVVRVGSTSDSAREGAIYLDASSTYAPFIDIFDDVDSWGDFGSASKTKVRLGQLEGITGTDEYGLFAGDGLFGDDDVWLRMSTAATELRNLTLRMHDGTNHVIVLDPSDPSLAIGTPYPTGHLASSGIWMGQDGADIKAHLGTVTAGKLTAGWSWDDGLTVMGDTLIGPGTTFGLENPRLFCNFEGGRPYVTNYMVDVNSFDGTRPTITGAEPMGVPGNTGKAYHGRGNVIRTNYIKNGLFGVNVTDSWNKSPSLTATRCTDEPFIGAGYANLTSTASNQAFYNQYAPAVGGDKDVVVSFWYRKGNNVRVRLYDSGGTATLAQTYDITYGDGDKDEWTFAYLQGRTASSGSVAVYVLFYLDSGEEIDIDGVVLTTGTVPCPFLFGSANGVDWSGTAHNSTSVQSGVEELRLENAVNLDSFTVVGSFIPHIDENDTATYVAGSGYSSYPFRPIQIGDYTASPSLAIGTWYTSTSTTAYYVDHNDSPWTDTEGKSIDYEAGESVFIAVTWDGTSLNWYGVVYGDAWASAVSVSPGDGFNSGGGTDERLDLMVADGDAAQSCEWVAVLDRAMTETELRQLFETGQAPTVKRGNHELWLADDDGAKVMGYNKGLYAWDDSGAEAFAIAAATVEWGTTYTGANQLSAGNIVLSDPDSEHLYLDGSSIEFKDGATVLGSLSSATWTLGDTDEAYLDISSSAITMYDSDGDDQLVVSAGEIVIGDESGGESVHVASDSLKMKAGGLIYFEIDSSSTIFTRTGYSNAGHVLTKVGTGADAGISIMYGSTVRGRWQHDGDIFIGSDISSPGSTYFSVFANNQTYNTEGMLAGDMLIGDNTAGVSPRANIKWDYTNGRMLFRGGQTTTLYIDTDGTLVAGSGEVALDADGITINAGAGVANLVKWVDSGTSIAKLWSNVISGDYYITLSTYAPATSSDRSLVMVQASANGSYDSAGIDLYSEDSSNVAHAALRIDTARKITAYDTAVQVGSTLSLQNSSTYLDDGLNIYLSGVKEFLALQGSSVAHGMTGDADTKTFGNMKPFSSSYGGLLIEGYCETASQAEGFVVEAVGQETDTRGTAGVAPIMLKTYSQSTTTRGNPTADKNILAIAAGGNTRFIFDSDGDLHMEGTVAEEAWDEYDDMALLHGFRAASAPGLKERWGEFINEARPVLEKTGVATFNEDGSVWYGVRGLQMLTVDALRQFYGEVQDRFLKYERELETQRLEIERLKGQA